MRQALQQRWYQREAIDSVFSYFAEHGGKFDATGKPQRANPVIALPTGTGKAAVIAWLIERILMLYPAQRFLMLVHVKELIEQNYDELLAIWPAAPVGIYSAGLRHKDTASQIVFGGIDSVINNVEAFGWRDILIVDECHLLSPADGSRYQTVISKLLTINPWLRVIGLSATTYRMGLGSITDNGIFTNICYDICNVEGFKRLIEDGHLAPVIPKRTYTELDVSSVGVDQKTGDYKQGELEQAVNLEHISRAALRELCEHGHDRHSWLVFTSGIDHSENCARILCEYGVPTMAIHSKLKAKERDRRFDAFRNGRIRAICGNNIFTTGFNHKPVDLIGVLRATLSVPLWVQMLGRGTRTFGGNTIFPPKTNCLVLDYAANSKRLGPIDDPHLPKRKGTGTGDPPCCICTACGTYNHARAVICIGCGGEITHEPKIVETAATTMLMTSDAPIYEWFPVTYQTAVKHERSLRPGEPPGPPTLRVTFITGIQRFNVWICLEHTGLPGHNARNWWRLFDSNNEPPVTIDDALRRFNQLATPKQIKVWCNRKYPEIVDYDFGQAAWKAA